MKVAARHDAEGRPEVAARIRSKARKFAEAGVKGMKWGQHRDKEIDGHMSVAIAAGKKYGMPGAARKIAAIQNSARKAGHYSDDHVGRIESRIDHHMMSGYSTPEQQRARDKILEPLDKAYQRAHSKIS
jgi:hypothetical protein